MAKYELRAIGDELAFVRQENAKMPLRALGFLQFSKKPPNTTLMCEVKNGEIMLWIEERRSQQRPAFDQNPLRPAEK